MKLWLKAQKDIEMGRQPRLCTKYHVQLQNVQNIGRRRHEPTVHDLRSLLSATGYRDGGFGAETADYTEDEDEDVEADTPDDAKDDEDLLAILNANKERGKEYVFQSMDDEKAVVLCVDDEGKKVELGVDGMDSAEIERLKNEIESGQKQGKTVKITVNEHHGKDKESEVIKQVLTACISQE